MRALSEILHFGRNGRNEIATDEIRPATLTPTPIAFLIEPTFREKYPDGIKDSQTEKTLQEELNQVRNSLHIRETSCDISLHKN